MKIAITGAHGTGKSTLVKFLSGYNEFQNYKIIDGISRKLPSGWKDKRNQAYVNSQYLLQHSLYKNFISARSFYDAWAYSRVNNGLTFYFNRFNLGTRLINYNFLFYVPIEFELSDDKYRPLDKSYQRQIDYEIKLLLDFYKLSYYTLTGTLSERIDTINKVLYGKKDI